MKKLLLIALLIVGCATKDINSTTTILSGDEIKELLKGNAPVRDTLITSEPPRPVSSVPSAGGSVPKAKAADDKPATEKAKEEKSEKPKKKPAAKKKSPAKKPAKKKDD